MILSKNPDRVEYLVNLLLIFQRLKCIADHAANIAEEAVYMIDGQMARYGRLVTEPE